MFSSFVDSKILCSFNVASEAIAHFDSRIEELRKTAIDEVIKSPPGVEGNRIGIFVLVLFSANLHLNF